MPHQIWYEAEREVPSADSAERWNCESSSGLSYVSMICAAFPGSGEDTVPLCPAALCCTDSVQGAFISRRANAASPRISWEYFSADAWDVPSAEILNIWAKLGGWMQGWEIIKRKEFSLLSLPLTIFLRWLSCAKRYKSSLKQFFKCECDISSTNHTFFRWKIIELSD